MPIQLPNYQAQTERVVKGFDNALEAYREKKRREKENRAFVRKKIMQEDQQKFALDQQARGQDFRKELAKSGQEFKLKLQQQTQDFQEDMAEENRDFQSGEAEKNREFQEEQTEDNREFQQEMYDTQRGDQVEDREDQQTHAEEMLDKRLEAQNETQTAQQYSRIMEDRKDNVQNKLDDKYAGVMQLGKIGYTHLTANDSGQVIMTNVTGGGFDGEDVTWDEFRQKMQKPLVGYEKYQEAQQGAEDGRFRRLKTDASPIKGEVTTEDGNKLSLFAVEPFQDRITKEIQTGGGSNGQYTFIERVNDGQYRPDYRSSVLGGDVKASSIYKEIVANPTMRFETDAGEAYEFNFTSENYSQLSQKLEELRNDSAMSRDGAESNDEGDMAERDRLNDFAQRVQNRMDRYSKLMDHSIDLSKDEVSAGDITDFRLRGANEPVDMQDSNTYYDFGPKDTSTQSGGSNDSFEQTVVGG